MSDVDVNGMFLESGGANLETFVLSEITKAYCGKHNCTEAAFDKLLTEAGWPAKVRRGTMVRLDVFCEALPKMAPALDKRLYIDRMYVNADTDYAYVDMSR